jgi:SprT protein
MLPPRRVAAVDVAVVARLVPEPARPYVAEVLGRHPVSVRLAPHRRTKLGDHRPPGRGVVVHRISINADLNPWAFLTTLLHEIAHAATWERHHVRRRRVRPHGREWQEEFSGLFRPLVSAELLPDDVARALRASLDRPRAATCSDRGLTLALRRYDTTVPGSLLVEDVPVGAVFRLQDGTAFRAGRHFRTRRQCFECRSGREYRVHGLLQVEVVPQAGTVIAVSGSATVRRTGPSAGASRPRG